MKNIISSLIIIIAVQYCSFAQTNDNLEFGVTVLELEKSKEYKTPNSTLFVFKGNTHLINNLLDLEKYIKKAIKKKSKKHIAQFNFELSSNKSSIDDLKKVPSKKYYAKNYDIICEVYLPVSEIKGFNNFDLSKRNQDYNIYITLNDTKTQKKILSFKLKVKSLNTISSQNKNTSKILVKTILETQTN